MRARRLGRQVRTAAAIAACVLVVGKAPAEAASDGTLVAPYESASSQGGIADVDGNLAVAAARNGAPTASVVAAHRLDSAASSVMYTARVRLDQAAVHAYDSNPTGWGPYYDAHAILSLRATAQHVDCATCRGASPEWSISVAVPGEAREVPLTLRVSNHAGGTVPPGTIRITVSLFASVQSADPSGPTPGNWLQCGPGMPGFCRICPFIDECGGSFATSVETAFAAGVAKLVSVGYEVKSSSTPNQVPTARFTAECWDNQTMSPTPYTCQFHPGGSSDPDGHIVNYIWDYGDGTPTESYSWAYTYPHRYQDGSKSYTVTLTVVDDSGGSDTETLTVKPNQRPTASFTVACSGADCSFDARGSSDPDGQIKRYHWSFGDGTQSEAGPTVEHRFPDASGSYPVTLTVTDDRYGSDTETRTVTPQAPNQAPTARFTVSCEKTACTFSGGSSSDPDGQITGYAWTFGDGTSSQTGPSVTHRYAEGLASYVVTLSVTDDRGGTDSESQTVTCTRKNANKPTTCR